MKVVINTIHGGFALSCLVALYIDERCPGLLGPDIGSRLDRCDGELVGGIGLAEDDPLRWHPIVVDAVEQLGALASGHLSKLKVVEIPDDVDFVITEYDGVEQIEERHRIWR